MSVNLQVDVPMENGHERRMILTRVGSGITSSARLQTGDYIKFAGLRVVINAIEHTFQKPGSDIAPNTNIYCSILGRNELDHQLMVNNLRDCGFKDVLDD